MSASDAERRAAILAAAAARGWFLARKTTAVWARELAEDTSVKSPEGSLQGRKGDMLCRGPRGESWVQARATLREKYVPTDEEDARGFRRWVPDPDAALVRASRLAAPVQLPTPWGPMRGEAGDVLVTPARAPEPGQDLDLWIVQRGVFEDTYELVEGDADPPEERPGEGH